MSNKQPQKRDFEYLEFLSDEGDIIKLNSRNRIRVCLSGKYHWLGSLELIDIIEKGLVELKNRNLW
jgi:hypothetical protein